jgi:hypothetical protein
VLIDYSFGRQVSFDLVEEQKQSDANRLNVTTATTSQNRRKKKQGIVTCSTRSGKASILVMATTRGRLASRISRNASRVNGSNDVSAATNKTTWRAGMRQEQAEQGRSKKNTTR